MAEERGFSMYTTLTSVCIACVVCVICVVCVVVSVSPSPPLFLTFSVTHLNANLAILVDVELIEQLPQYSLLGVAAGRRLPLFICQLSRSVCVGAGELCHHVACQSASEGLRMRSQGPINHP